MSLDINAALGETEEYRDEKVLPASLYPMRLSIIDLGVSDLRDDGSGGTPYIELNGDIYDGPFKGYAVKKRVYISVGKKGGYLGLFAGWCKQITRQPANVSVFAKYDCTLPPQGTMADADYKKAVREALLAWWGSIDPATRVQFVNDYLRLGDWNGKQAIASITVEERVINQGKEGERTLAENRFNGMYALDHKDYGMKYFQTVETHKQEEAKSAMQEAGLL